MHKGTVPIFARIGACTHDSAAAAAGQRRRKSRAQWRAALDSVTQAPRALAEMAELTRCMERLTYGLPAEARVAEMQQPEIERLVARALTRGWLRPVVGAALSGQSAAVARLGFPGQTLAPWGPRLRLV